MDIDEWDAERIMTLATEANIAAMNESAALVEREAKQSMPKQGAGATYDGTWREGAWYERGSGKRRKKHYASRPGSPPAVDTGDLKKSVRHEVIQRGDEVVGFVGSDLPYALPLETGTKNMEPRPFLRPALRNTGQQVEQIFKEANS
jgi:HK97 gp10 family phage protein